MKEKQAVVETTLGEMVFDLLPEKAPNHVGYFMKLAAEGAFDRTSFHRVVKYGIVQGGDPKTKDPSAQGRVRHGRPRASRPRALRREAHPRSHLRRSGSRQARFRRLAVLHRGHRSTEPRRTVHRFRPRLGRHGRGAEDFGNSGRREGTRDGAGRDREGNSSRQASSRGSAVLDRDRGGASPVPRGARDLLRRDRSRALSRQGGEPREEFPAARRDRRVRGPQLPPHRARVRRPDGIPRHPKRAPVGAHPEIRPEPRARVQRRPSRARSSLHGPRGRARERLDVVLHRHRDRDLPRPQVHRLRPGHRRHGSREGHRGRPDRRRQAPRPGRALASAHREGRPSLHARRRHCRRWARRTRHRHRMRKGGSLPHRSREGLARRRHPALPRQHGVLHDTRAPGDWRAPAHLHRGETDPARVAQVLPAGGVALPHSSSTVRAGARGEPSRRRSSSSRRHTSAASRELPRASGRGTWFSPAATTTTPIVSASRARISRRYRTTSRRLTLTSDSKWRSSAARTPPRSAPSSSSAPECR